MNGESERIRKIVALTYFKLLSSGLRAGRLGF
jgi:hypothetical protein